MDTSFWWKNLLEISHSGDRVKWEDDIKMDVMKTGCKDVNRIEWAQDNTEW
jgi:hypothetical protein